MQSRDGLRKIPHILQSEYSRIGTWWGNYHFGMRESNARVFLGAVRSMSVSHVNRLTVVTTHPHANALVDRASGENVGIVLVPVDAQNLIVVRLDRVHRTLICAKRNMLLMRGNIHGQYWTNCKER